MTSSLFREGRGQLVSGLSDFMEVTKMQNSKPECMSEPKIYGVKISQDGDTGYCISVRHTGHFRLSDYEELDIEVKSVKLVKRG
jgi:hypothetical protein